VARRSPLNERYQKNTAPSGKTRKSAAAAKPKRSSSAPSASKSSGRSKAKGTGTRPPVVIHPTSPEYKRMRLIWWGLLIAAVLVTTASWAVRAYTPYLQASNYILGAGYAFIFAALYVDWAKLRPMRQEWMKSGQAVAAGKVAELEKEERAQAKAKLTAEKTVTKKVTVEETTTETVTSEQSNSADDES